MKLLSNTFVLAALFGLAKAEDLSDDALTEILEYNYVDAVPFENENQLLEVDSETQKNVNLSEKSLRKTLADQTKVNAMQAKAKGKLHKWVKRADLDTTSINDNEKFTNTKYMSKMTLYHWNLFTINEQLKMY